MPSHPVWLGASDWRHPDWLGPFYPVGMPDEWRLAYYNTQYSCVWLPHSAWSLLAPGEVAAWLDDARPEFRFLLEAGDGDDPPLRMAFGSRLAAHCRGDDPDLLWFARGVDLRALAARLSQRAAAPGRTFLLSRDGDLATLDQVRTLLAVLGLGPGGRVG